MAGQRSPEDDAELTARLKKLGERLGAENERRERDRDDPARPRVSANPAGLARALRLSSEFVAGIVVGGLIGWLIDRVAGVSPWGLIVFVLLGFVAGTLNVLRSAGLATPPDRSRDRK
jgi:ATP synthase protein I